MNKKGVVLGRGYLGTRISEEFGYSAFGRKNINPLDLFDLQHFLSRERPDILINAIGKTGRPNIDWCEDHKEETMQSNVVVAANLATECVNRGIYFMHLGSGCVYRGDNEGKGFSEKDEPNFYGPQFYAKTKILAEKILSEFPGSILRIRMPIDNKPHSRNLIDKLIKYEKVIDIPNSMTTVPHMLEVIKQLINKKSEGIYNLVNPGTISPAEIMTIYKDIVDPTHKFKIFSGEELDKITKGKRSNCYLNTDKLKYEELEMPEIHKAVESCLLKYKEFKKWKE